MEYHVTTRCLFTFEGIGIGDNEADDGFIQHLSPVDKKGLKAEVPEMTSSITTMTSYDTMLLETQGSAAVYTLVSIREADSPS